MKTLGRLLTWWERQSDSDFYASMEIDTHRWANRSALARRPSGPSDQDPPEQEPESLTFRPLPSLQ